MTPDGSELVFIVGAPRSGTTWLQRMMGDHPAVVTTQETALLDKYCAPLLAAWAEQLPSDPDAWRRQRHRGLPAVLTTEEFEGLVGDLARAVYTRSLELKPGARVIVDKNPDHALHSQLIRKLFPGAAVLHIIRDGRDVASSMVAASRGWGKEWAPSQVWFAAQTWQKYVEAAMAAEHSGRYLEVRYEDLVADPSRHLASCLSFAGLDVTETETGELVASAGRATAQGDSLVWSGEVLRRLGEAPAEPEGFFGADRTQRWPQSWGTRDRLAFDDTAGDLLRRLGYVADSTWTKVTRWDRVRAAQAHQVAQRARRLGWALHMMLGRRGLYVHVARTQPYR